MCASTAILPSHHGSAVGRCTNHSWVLIGSFLIFHNIYNIAMNCTLVENAKWANIALMLIKLWV